MKQILIDKVIEQIKIDIEIGDVTALDVLLDHISEDVLLSYLSECDEEA
jgi:hypothetical protein